MDALQMILALKILQDFSSKKFSIIYPCLNSYRSSILVRIMNQLVSSTSQRFVEAGAVHNVSGKHKAFAAIGLNEEVCF